MRPRSEIWCPFCRAHSRTAEVCSRSLAVGPAFWPLVRLRAALPLRRAAATKADSESRSRAALSVDRSISYWRPSRPKVMVSTASLPSRSSTSRVCTCCATGSLLSTGLLFCGGLLEWSGKSSERTRRVAGECEPRVLPALLSPVVADTRSAEPRPIPLPIRGMCRNSRRGPFPAHGPRAGAEPAVRGAGEGGLLGEPDQRGHLGERQIGPGDEAQRGAAAHVVEDRVE